MEEIEEVYGSAMIENKLCFFVKWKNFPSSSNSWQEFKDIKTSSALEKYINQLWTSFEVVIEVNKDIYKRKLTSRIKDLRLKTPLKIRQILELNNFDAFKFKTYQLNFHFLTPHESFEKEFEELFVMNEGYILLKEQEEKFQKYILRMSVVDHFTSVKILNNFDFKAPDSFKYLMKNKLMISNGDDKTRALGCLCAENCTKNEANCCGSVKQQQDEENAPIIECNDNCKCDATCSYRKTQKSFELRDFTLYKSKHRGWALQTNMKFSKDSFIFEITGLLCEKSAVISNSHKSFFCAFTLNKTDFVIDAYEFGNISRFINHHCEPNAQVLLITDRSNNLKSTRLGVFALRDIVENEEITVNYDKCSIGCLNSNVKCLCGSSKCKGYIYSSAAATAKKLSSANDTIEIFKPSERPILNPMVQLERHFFIPNSTNNDSGSLERSLDSQSLVIDETVEEEEEDEEKTPNIKKKCEQPNCEYEYSQDKTYKDHLLRDHNIGKAIICRCGFIFINKESYDTHIKLVNSKSKTSMKKVYELIKSLKKEFKNSNYQWMHNKKVKAPKPKNSQFIKGFPSLYEKYLSENFENICAIQMEHFAK